LCRFDARGEPWLWQPQTSGGFRPASSSRQRTLHGCVTGAGGGIALIAHAWVVILGSIALVAIFPNPVTWILAVMLVGSRQHFANYHLEHHLLMYVPCYNLPKLHAILMGGPLAARMEVPPNYLTVLRMATALPNAQDRRGALVNNARRMRSGVSITGDQASSGF
jgi:hypothetical protein